MTTRNLWQVYVPRAHEAAHGLNFVPTQYIPVVALLARGYDKALSQAREMYGESCYVGKQRIPSGFKRDPHWRGGLFYSKPSKFGQLYFCLVCERKHKGMGGGYNHSSGCPFSK